MRRILLLFIVLLPSIGYSKFILSNNIKQAQELLYQFRLPEARILIQKEIKDNPINSYAHYLEHTLIFMYCIGRESEDEFDGYEERLNELLELVESDKEIESPWYRLCIGEMRLFQSALYAKYEHNWTAGRRAYSGMKDIQLGYDQHPEFVPYQSIVGLLEVAVGSVPDNYKFLTSWLGMSGTIESGFAKMRYAASPENVKDFEFLKVKHYFFYAFALEHLKPEESILTSEFPGMNNEKSELLLFVDAKVYISRGKIDAAIQLLQSNLKGGRYNDMPYLYFLLGKYKVARRDSDGADILLQYLNVYKGSQYIKSAYKLLWQDALLRKQPDLAKLFHQKILTEGNDKSGADREALFSATYPIHLNLVKANLQFDAGKFPEALVTLNGTRELITSRIEKIELNYRYGRVLQGQKRLALALKYFNLAVQYTEGDPTTFALANSWLQKGVISEDLGDYKGALTAYKKALQLKGYAYYEGIQQRSKAGVERCNELLRTNK